MTEEEALKLTDQTLSQLLGVDRVYSDSANASAHRIEDTSIISEVRIAIGHLADIKTSETAERKIEHIINARVGVFNALDQMRSLPPEKARTPTASGLTVLIPRRGTIISALINADASLTTLHTHFAPQEWSNLLPNLPGQNTGPLKFAFDGGRLSVVRQPTELREGDSQNAAEARRHLAEWAGEIADYIDGSNSLSPVLKAALQKVFELLPLDHDVIRLGIASNRVTSLVSGLHEELSDAIYSDLTQFATEVSDFVAQFPEWRRYLENAAATNRAGSGNLHSGDKWNFCLTLA